MPMSEATADPAATPPEDLPWQDASFVERLRRVEAALDERVRPMLAADGGGIEVMDLKGEELTIQYSGACGACAASTGGTLFFVEEALADQLGVTLKLIVHNAPPPAAPPGDPGSW